MPGALILFDIDGTLLLDDAYAHGLAMVRAARAVYGVALDDRAVIAIHPHGKTDRQILRAMLTAAGLDDRAIDARAEDWVATAGREFDAIATGAADDWTVRPGLTEALTDLRARGHRPTLLTGNLEPIARTKVRRMGVDGLLDLDAGAYGTDAEDRAELVPLARRRAAAAAGEPWPRAATVVVGDTAADVAAARSDGVRVVLFASERVSRDDDHGADAVIDDIAELPPLLP